MKIQLQERNECMLATIAMHADVPLDIVRRYACEGAGVERWHQLFSTGPPARRRFDDGVRWALKQLRREDLYPLLRGLDHRWDNPGADAGFENTRRLSNRIRSLPQTGRGCVRVGYRRSRLYTHIMPWHRGLIYDPSSGRAWTLCEYRRAFGAYVIEITHREEGASS